MSGPWGQDVRVVVCKHNAAELCHLEDRTSADEGGLHERPVTMKGNATQQNVASGTPSKAGIRPGYGAS